MTVLPSGRDETSGLGGWHADRTATAQHLGEVKYPE